MRTLVVVMCLIGGCSVRTATPGDGGVDPGTDAGRVSRPDSGIPGCDPRASSGDQDSDGFDASIDCDDCSPSVNPGAFDFPGNSSDEDCQGGDATALAACDTGIAIASQDANDAARAIGLCQFTDMSSRNWGVISARFTRADGAGPMDSPLQTGILPVFGVVGPQQGTSMLALSSGIARAPGQADHTSECDMFGTTEIIFGMEYPVPPDPTPFPPGFPVESPTCSGVETGPVYNAAALEVQIRVPTNARSLRFRSTFYTFEYPDYICSEYNDFFVTLMSPRPAGLANDNIVFDADGNLVSVNTSLLQVCEPGNHGGHTFDCPLGIAQLSMTGFDGTQECGTGAAFGGEPIGQHTRAATGWLRTIAPVVGGSIITLRFTVWDSGDPDLDSTVLIDGFEWDVEEGPVSTDPILI